MAENRATSSKADFFEAGSFALVGDSAARRFPSLSERYLREAGKEVHSVDLAGAAGGRLGSLDDLPAGLERAVVEVAKERSEEVVRALLDRGFRRLWLHQATDTPGCHELCAERAAGLETGGCAVMYVAPASTPHVLHRAIWKLIGRY